MNALVDLLPLSWQPKAKAIIAAGGGAILGYAVVGGVTGQWDRDAFAGLLLVFIGVPVYGAPNRDYQPGAGPSAGEPLADEDDVPGEPGARRAGARRDLVSPPSRPLI